MKVFQLIHLVANFVIVVYLFIPQFINPYALIYLGAIQYLGNPIILLINWFSNSKPFNIKKRGRYALGATLTLLYIIAIGSLLGDFPTWGQVIACSPVGICALGYIYICFKELNLKFTHENINHRWMNL